jgi:succinoglycan biosynthesis protein ExoA
LAKANKDWASKKPVREGHERMTGVLAVIPCLNEEKYIEKLVLSLLPAAKSIPMRIVIVDGDSSDHTSNIAQRLAAEHPEVLSLYNPKRFQSAAVNLAVAVFGSTDRYLIRLDAHADYPANFCQLLIGEAESSDAASVTAPMNTVGITWFQRAVATAQNSYLGNGGAQHRSTADKGMMVDHGHHALMRISAFRAVGGYDDTFSHNEDAELDFRLRKAGYKIWLTAKTCLNYYPRSRPWALFMQYMSFGAGRARTSIKHKALPKIRQLIPVPVAPTFILALAAPESDIAVMPISLWAGVCLGYGIVLGVRDRSTASAMAGPAAMIMHMAWSIGFWRCLLSIPR